jgi:hypothetical protein
LITVERSKVQGKTKGVLDVPVDCDENSLKQLIFESDVGKRHLANKTITRTVVRNHTVNFVLLEK